VNLLRCFKCIISFFTILPVRTYCKVEDIFKHQYITPLVVPLITGLIPAGLAYTLIVYVKLPKLLVIVLTYTSLLLLTGFNHIDGFADTVDALMFRGSVEERLKILKDPHIGTAGVVSIIIILLTSITALTYLNTYLLVKTLYISEVLSKTTYCLCARWGKYPSYTGLGYHVVYYARNTKFFTLRALALSIPQTWIVLGIYGLLVYTITSISSIAIFLKIQKYFNGAVGDVFGFILEFSRTLCIVLILICLG